MVKHFFQIFDNYILLTDCFDIDGGLFSDVPNKV